MYEMLVQNWLTSSIEPKGIDAAKKRVWAELERRARPTTFERAWKGFTWFFTQPIRTAAFSLALLMIAVMVGHVLPTQLREQRWQRTQALLDIEVSILEEENQLLDYVLE